MPARQLQGVIHHLRRAIGARGLREVPDAELLKRFTADRDEAAFELLVWRHGKMVFNVCRRVCRDSHDAEDAFQAAFLVLVRKAGTISKGDSIGGWLYKVAYRVAQTARVRAARHSGHLQTSADLEAVPGATDPASTAAWREVRRLIDDELHRLPDKYRLPFVLCHLEGHSNTDAARELGCPVGTVESRLTRARQRLRGALTRRGVTLSAGLSAALFSRHMASASTSAELVQGTVEAAAAGLVSSPVAALTEGVLKTMFLTKLKTAAAVLMAVGIIAGAGGWTYRSMAVATAGDDDPSKIVKDADADGIVKLIDQLGSDSFAEREAASRNLARVGAPALEALRKAAKSSDVETRRRAEALVKKIEKTVNSRELLQAKRVHLRLKDTPLPKAVAELAKQSGYDVALDDPDGKLKERTVTLDTGDVPFWQAMDLLCQAGGVSEAVADGAMGIGFFPPARALLPALPAGALPALPLLPPAPVGGALPPPAAKAPPAAPIGGAKPPKAAGKQSAPPAGLPPPAKQATPPAAPPGAKIAPPQAVAKAPPGAGLPPAGKALPAAPALPAGGGKLPPAGVVAPPIAFGAKLPPATGNAPNPNSRLVLKDGKAKTSPTAYIGAVRVRPTDAKHTIPTPPTGDGETSLGLRFSLEPKLLWRGLTRLHLKAVDDQGQTLEQAADADATMVYGANLSTALRLKKGEKPAKSIKELKGTLTAEVFGPVKPILTVDNLLKASGKTIKGEDGASLEVLEVAKGKGGVFTVKLALDAPADSMPGVAAAGVVAVALAPAGGAVPLALPAAKLPPGAVPPPLPAAKLAPPAAGAAGVAVALRVQANGQESEIALVDNKGKTIEMMDHSLGYRAKNLPGATGYTHMHQFTFQLPKDEGTIKLVFSGRRPATIEVPFTLKNVPLP